MSKSTIQEAFNPTQSERAHARLFVRSTMRSSWMSAPISRFAVSFAVVILLVSSQTLPTDSFYEVRRSVIEGLQHMSTRSDDELLLDANQLLERIDDEDSVATQGAEL